MFELGLAAARLWFLRLCWPDECGTGVGRQPLAAPSRQGINPPGGWPDLGTLVWHRLLQAAHTSHLHRLPEALEEDRRKEAYLHLQSEQVASRKIPRWRIWSPAVSCFQIPAASLAPATQTLSSSSPLSIVSYRVLGPPWPLLYTIRLHRAKESPRQGRVELIETASA